MDYVSALVKLLMSGYQLTSPTGETIYISSGVLIVEKDNAISQYTDPYSYAEILVLAINKNKI